MTTPTTETRQQIKHLEDRLHSLVDQWYKTNEQSKKDAIVRAYSEAVDELYALGWDGVIDLESELPDNLMPASYLERNPVRATWSISPLSKPLSKQNP